MSTLDNSIEKGFIKELWVHLSEYLLNKHSIKIAPLTKADFYLLQERWQECSDEVKNLYPEETFWGHFLKCNAISNIKTLPIFINRIRSRFKHRTITTYFYDESLFKGTGYPVSLLINISKDWKPSLLKIGRTTQSLLFYGDIRQIEDFIRYPKEVVADRLKWNDKVCKASTLNPSLEKERLKSVYNLHKDYIKGVSILKGEAPCYSDRCDDISHLVIHFTETSIDGALDLFLSKNEREVSAHFVIDMLGNIIQLVDLHKRAHHAGKGEFYFENLCRLADKSLNSMSIGIELVSFGNLYTRAQIHSLIELSKVLHLLYPALSSPYNIIGHQEASLVKLDPGPNFPWLAYLRELFPNDYPTVVNPNSSRRRLRSIFKNPSTAMIEKARLLGYSLS